MSGRSKPSVNRPCSLILDKRGGFAHSGFADRFRAKGGTQRRMAVTFRQDAALEIGRVGLSPDDR
jgi:hypothetical protein